jgi:hypothetical protein
MIKKLLACITAGVVMGALAAGTAFAKLPPTPPMTDEQKAEKAAKDKAAEEKEEALVTKYREKAVANYKKNKAVAEAKTTPAKKK